MREVVITQTGSANTASVVACVKRMGLAPKLTQAAEDIERAELVVFPGVGSFGAVMGELKRLGIDGAIAGRVRDDAPTLGICLGMQVMFEWSEESVGVAGLGVIPGGIARFSGDVRIPQMGWNELRAGEGFGGAARSWVYYANSYRAELCPEGWSAAWSEHGGEFVGALRKGRVLLCQFHPELSGDAGRELVESWAGVKGAA